MRFKDENKEIHERNHTNLPPGLFNLLMKSFAQDVYSGETGLFHSLN